MESGVVYDAFVSYSRSDEADAAELNGWLRAQGLRTFFDRSELKSGLRWIPGLEDAICRSRGVVILVGRHGIGNTQQYERELALVRQTRDPAFPVIPVLMPGCESPPTGFLQLLTWVDLSKGASVLQQPNSLSTLRAALDGEATATSAIRATICPYRGLEPFREEDAPFFCGRDEAIRELVAQAQANSFVAVVGPSGSGKSSLVFAGLLPSLRRESRTTMWDVVAFRPGKWPLRALAAAFGAAPDNAGPAAIDTYLEEEAAAYRAGDADKLARIVNDRLDAVPEKPDRLLIYVDQWEELYAMAPPAEDKEGAEKHAADVEKFVALMVAAASTTSSPANLVLTVRADFYTRLVENRAISALLPRQQVNIRPMKLSDLRSAIVTPARKAGLTFAPPELVDQILNDVGLEEGRLPLLQFALKETWERREGCKLVAGAYTAVGGVTGAIEKTAEASYERLTASQKDAARRLFLGLVTPGEGREDTRSRSRIPDDPEQRDVISLFSNPKIRLLVTGFASIQETGQAIRDVRATVEVAHEALIQRWPTLRAWVAQNRENLRARSAVLRAMNEWEEKSKSDDYLLPHGVQLERGRALLASPEDVPIDDVRDYVERSIKAEEERLAAEREADLADQKRLADAERQAKEAAEEFAREAAARAAIEAELRTTAEQKTFAERHARGAAEEAAREAAARATIETELRTTAEQKTLVERRAREEAETSAAKLRVRLITTAVAVGFALCFGFVSFYEYERASKLAEVAFGQAAQRLRQLAEVITIFAERAVVEDPAKALLIATQAENLGVADSPRIQRILFAALRNLHLRRVISDLPNPVLGVAYSPDGSVIASLDNASLRFWDAKDGELIDSLSLAAPGSFGLTWSANNDWIGVNLRNRTLLLRPCAHGKIGSLFRSCQAGDHDQQIVLGDHDTAGGLPKFSNDGKWLVTGSWGEAAALWNIATGTATPLGTKKVATPNDVAISPDSKTIAFGFENAEIQLVDSSSGKTIQTMRPGTEKYSVLALAFNPQNSNMLAASLQNGEIIVWDVNLNTYTTLNRTGGIAYSLIFNPDGKRLASASDDQVVRTWSTEKLSDNPTLFRGHTGPAYCVAYSPDSSSLASGSADKTIRIWNQHSPVSPGVKSGRPIDSENPPKPPQWSSSIRLPPRFGDVVAYARQGDRAIVASKEGELALFIIGTDSEPVDRWRSPEDIAALRLEHDPGRIVATSKGGWEVSWPFFPSVHELVRFVDDHIPFDGNRHLTLTKDELCAISSPEEGCSSADASGGPL